MSFRVVVTLQAELDSQAVFDWLFKHSPAGAFRWFAEYEAAVDLLTEHAEGCAAAIETGHRGFELKQLLFGTARGRRYRLIFTICDREVRILRVRGPGQAPINA